MKPDETTIKDALRHINYSLHCIESVLEEWLPIQIKEMLTMEEAARYMSIEPSDISDMIEKEEISFYDYNGEAYFSKSELIEFLKTKSTYYGAC